MTRLPDVAPETVPHPSPGSPDATRTTHPAFGQISLTRQSGGGLLYGSPFDHQYCVRLTISRSTMDRHLSNDWHHDSIRNIVEVNMTEAQWNEFVSSVGNGSGVCCTLRYTETDGVIPGIAQTEKRLDRFQVEHDQALTDMQTGINELRLLLGDAKLSGTAKSVLLGKLSGVEAKLTSSIPFIKEQFAEFVDETVSTLRAEANGLSRLPAADPAPLQIETASEPKDVTPRVRERTRIRKED